jgi:SAM-dependent methyltransferase
MRMFVTVVPGLASLTAPYLERVPGVRVTGTGCDGRSDLILLEAGRGARAGLWSSPVIEDLFVEVGRTSRAPGDQPDSIARRIWHPAGAEKALSVWSQEVRPLAGAMTYRVIARVLREQGFVRTDLREALTEVISQHRPRWKIADPAQIEIWVTEYQPGRLLGGLRLSDGSMRQHGRRQVERSGALRPTVAALMVALAGEPDGALLDPCCGSGTVLSEALAGGWPAAFGVDIDPAAIETSRQNVPAATVEHGDARKLAFRDDSISAVVSNLPFGRLYGVQGTMTRWLTAVLAEMTRVTRPGGRMIVLAPAIRDAAVPGCVEVLSENPVRLLGTLTRLWVLARS